MIPPNYIDNKFDLRVKIIYDTFAANNNNNRNLIIMNKGKWHKRYGRVLANLGINNNDVSNIIGTKHMSINNTTCESGEAKGWFPRWAKFAVVVWETMYLRVKKLEVEIEELKCRLK